jgi:nucleoside-diphosphate-sugar epimerase
MTETAPLSSCPVLVTGGGGFLGSAIVRQLVAQGARVRSLSRSRYPHLEALGVEQFQGDLASNPETLDRACRGADLVFHVASKTGVWGPYGSYHRINVVGTRNVLSACRANRITRLIYTSSPSVVFQGGDMEGIDESAPYPRTYQAPYPQTKAAAEKLVREAADDTLRTIALRPHLIWGPEDNHLVPRIIQRHRRLRQIGDGRNKVDTIYVDNAAHAHLLAATKLAEKPQLSGRVYFISQDEPVRLWEMVNAILAAADRPPVRRSISVSTAHRIGSVLEWLYRLLRLPGEPEMTRFVAAELATSHWFDISAAKRDLGYRPLITTDEGLRRLKQWIKANAPYSGTSGKGE